MKKKKGRVLRIILNVLIGLLGAGFIAAAFLYSDWLLEHMKTPSLVSDAEMPQQFLFSAVSWWEENEFPSRTLQEEPLWLNSLEEAEAQYENYLATLPEDKRTKIEEQAEYMMSPEVQKKLKNRIHNSDRTLTVTDISSITPAIDPDGKLVVIYSLTVTRTTYDDDENEIETRQKFEIYGRLPEEE